MGYVSTGSISAEGADHEFSGRQHRRTRAGNRALERKRIARLGESLAATFLEARGGRVVGRNVRAGRGEIDLLVRMESTLVAVEVKTRTVGDAGESFTSAKAGRVWETVGRLTPRPQRVDLIAIQLTSAGAEIRWVPGV